MTGFLGPNGAGKSTTMRMIIGLDFPTGGSVTVNGRLYAKHAAPLHEVGTLLEAKSVHPGRTAFNHLMALARTHGIPRRRVDEVIELAGLGSVAGKRVGGFSLGMGQRLGIAAALLGDPAIVMLDEPVNGLDPEGVLWVRNLLSGLAAEGRAVMLSSHLMAETALIADHLVIIGRGRLLADTTMDDFVLGASGGGVKVATTGATKLRTLLAGPDVTISSSSAEELIVSGRRDAGEIGAIAAQHGLPLSELTPQSASLEAAFMELTRDVVEYHTALPSTPPEGLPDDDHHHFQSTRPQDGGSQDELQGDRPAGPAFGVDQVLVAALQLDHPRRRPGPVDRLRGDRRLHL
ncbi:MAG: ATP-binding cassette domain-containing protein [Nocardioidaceae bacterium]